MRERTDFCFWAANSDNCRSTRGGGSASASGNNVTTNSSSSSSSTNKQRLRLPWRAQNAACALLCVVQGAPREFSYPGSRIRHSRQIRAFFVGPGYRQKTAGTLVSRQRITTIRRSRYMHPPLRLSGLVASASGYTTGHEGLRSPSAFSLFHAAFLLVCGFLLRTLTIVFCAFPSSFFVAALSLLCLRSSSDFQILSE